MSCVNVMTLPIQTLLLCLQGPPHSQHMHTRTHKHWVKNTVQHGGIKTEVPKVLHLEELVISTFVCAWLLVYVFGLGFCRWRQTRTLHTNTVYLVPRFRYLCIFNLSKFSTSKEICISFFSCIASKLKSQTKNCTI